MRIFIALGILTAMTVPACNHPLVTGRDVETDPMTQTFTAPAEAAFEAAEQALRDLEYKVEYANKDERVLRTGWIPTKVDSHYLVFFNRRDYGVTGSYYHLAVRITEDEPGQSQVVVAAPLRSVVSRMRSSYTEEKKFLSRVANLLRPADITVTNIGVIDRPLPPTIKRNND